MGSLTEAGSSTSSVFGTPNYTLFPAEPPSGGGTYNGFVSSSGGGGLYCLNPGLSDFGSGTEFRMEAPTTTGNGGINKFAVDTYSNSTRVAYLRHNVRFGKSSGGSATSGNFYFIWGESNSTNSFHDNNLPNITNGNNGEVFVGVRVVFNSDGTLSSNYLVPGANNAAGTWTGTFDTQPFVQNETYTVEYFMYNEPGGGGTNTYNYNGSPVSITKYYWHVYVNGVRATTGGIPGEYPSGGAKQNAKLSSYMFYGESSTSNACMFLDNSYYNTSLTYSYTDYYSKSTGNLDQFATWGSNPDGSGESPTNFSTDGITYHIQNNPNPTLGAAWNVSGTGHKVILGDGISTCNFTIPSGFAMAGTLDISNYGTLILQNTTYPSFGLLSTGSTVRYAASGNQNVAGVAYSNLQIFGSGTKTLAGAANTTNASAVGDGTSAVTFLIPTAYAFSGIVDVNQLGVLDIQNATSPTLGTLAPGSTVRYNYAGNQNVAGNTYYTLDIANSATKMLQGNTTVTDLVFSGGTLALNNFNLFLAGKYISFYSSNALFTDLSAAYTDNFIGGQGVGRIWSTNGSLTNSVDVSLSFPYATTPATMYLWYKGDGGVWTKGALYTPSYAGGNASITITGLTNLSGTGAKGNMEWTFAEIDETLPVELSSFTALFSNMNTVTLQWVTQSETNVSGFRIYRNTEAELSSATMLNVFVPATNTSQLQVYVVTDEEIYQDGVYYYWLENLDMDGSSTLHGPISINVILSNHASAPIPVINGLNKAYPNPFHPEVNLELSMDRAGWMELEIYNLKGQRIRTIFSGSMDKGTKTLKWDSRDEQGQICANGIYFAVMKSNIGIVSQMKLMLMK